MGVKCTATCVAKNRHSLLPLQCTEALQCEYAVQGHRGLYGEPLSSALLDLNTKEGRILNLMKDHCNVIKQHNQLWTLYFFTLLHSKQKQNLLTFVYTYNLQ